MRRLQKKMRTRAIQQKTKTGGIRTKTFKMLLTHPTNKRTRLYLTTLWWKLMESRPYYYTQASLLNVVTAAVASFQMLPEQ